MKKMFTLMALVMFSVLYASAQKTYVLNSTTMKSAGDKETKFLVDGVEFTIKGTYKVATVTDSYLPTALQYRNGREYTLTFSEGMKILTVTFKVYLDDNKNSSIAFPNETIPFVSKNTLANNGGAFTAYVVTPTSSRKEIAFTPGKKANLEITIEAKASSSMPTATLAASGLGTFCSTQTCKCPEGLSAYTAQYESGKVNLTQIVNGVIPANTGVVLSGEAGKTYTMAKAQGSISDIPNDLKGLTEEKTFETGNYYVLVCNNGKSYFAKLDDNQTVAAGKAYLDLTTQNVSTNTLSFSMGDVTAIKNVKADKANDNKYYSLDGREIEKSAHGVYIHNGKKYVK